MEENPCRIQSGPSDAPDATPLVLFHDAGGTTIQYFSLADLDRPLYGMSNVYFEQGGGWEHGIREMGVVYTQRVRSVITSGKILLGGWSLGGSIAMEVAARLMRLPQYTVVGIIMIDSIFPTDEVTERYPRTISEVAIGFPLPAQLSDARRANLQSCILNAHNMHRAWKPPQFASKPPPTVLLRATERMSEDPESPHYLDLIRNNNVYLGWEVYGTEFFRQCLEVPGNHFTMFDHPHCQGLSACIRQACSLLENRTLEQ